MQIGYARVSTADQSPDLQEDGLQKAGCEKIFRVSPASSGILSIWSRLSRRSNAQRNAGFQSG